VKIPELARVAAAMVGLLAMPSRRSNEEQGPSEAEALALVAKIRNALRTKAEAAGLRGLEEKTGHARGYLSHLFSGTIKNLTLQQVFELLLALDIPFETFFSEIFERDAAPPAAGLSRDELFGLVDAYMERRSGAAPEKPAKMKPKAAGLKSGK
jgi:hypothetical protein